MAGESFTNQAKTTLSGTITSSVTSLTVASAALFPSVGNYRIVIDSEIIIVTGGQGTTTWTGLTRGAEGTTAAGHAAGAQVALEITAASLQWAGGAPAGGRLSQSGGSAVYDGSVGGLNIYYLPYASNRLALLNSNGDTQLFEFASSAALTLSPSTQLTALYGIYDLFAQIQSGAPALTYLQWTQATGAITGVTNASPMVVTSNAHGLSVGDLVGIYGVGGTTAANDYWFVSAATTNTFTLGGGISGNSAYTSGGHWVKLNAVSGRPSLTYSDVGLALGADQTQRYLGTVLIDGATGSALTADTPQKRLVWNNYNRRPRAVSVLPSGNWTYSSGTWRLWNASASSKFVQLVGQIEDSANLMLSSTNIPSSGGSNYSTLGLDTNAIAQLGARNDAGGVNTILSPCTLQPGAGPHLWLMLEAAFSTGTFYGTNPTDAHIQSGLVGTVWA